MSDTGIRFDDGAAYERMMGAWSRIAGKSFLDWVEPEPGWRWIDVGCGNGAFTELIARHCAPAAIDGIDPSPGQIAFASTRPGARPAAFRTGDAMDLPFEAASFDAAVMALVLFFVPQPEKGVSEMVRVVRPGGLVSAYVWDMQDGGFPLQVLQDAISAAGGDFPQAPRREVSTLPVLRRLWEEAGLAGVQTREFIVERRFENGQDHWDSLTSGHLGAALSRLSPGDQRAVRDAVRSRFPEDGAGAIVRQARARAVMGRKPG